MNRIACPDCGIGIIGRHMKRHRHSKACAERQLEMQQARAVVRFKKQPKPPLLDVSVRVLVLQSLLRYGFGSAGEGGYTIELNGALIFDSEKEGV